MLFTVFIYTTQTLYCNMRRTQDYYLLTGRGEKCVKIHFAGLPPWLRDRTPIDFSSFSLHLTFLNFYFGFCFFFFFSFLLCHLRARDVFDNANGSMCGSMLEHPLMLSCREKIDSNPSSLALTCVTRIKGCLSNVSSHVDIRVRGCFSRKVCLDTSAGGREILAKVVKSNSLLAKK